VEGRDLFSQDHEPREFVISARDRCGIAVDRIRSVRTDRYRYIRNDLTDRALYQSQYRDKFATLVELREKFSEGQLTPLQASYHRAEDRPEEELYDLETDPDQVNNLANDPTCQEVLTRHRQILDKWINETGDKGQVMDSQEELRRVYEVAKGKVESPEFEFLNEAGEKKD
jgi:hypothetical protein